MQCDAMQAQLGLAQAEIKAAEANACRPMHHLPSLANQHIVGSRLRQPRISSIRPSPMQQHRPHANKSILHPINVFQKYIISLEGWEQIQWSTSYILSQARLVQVRIRCLLYVNFRAMSSLYSKKCNSRFLKIQIILSLIKFILKITNIYIFKQI